MNQSKYWALLSAFDLREASLVWDLLVFAGGMLPAVLI